MITMVIIGVIGIALASYLTLTGAQYKSVVRSQTWNTSIPIVEAGIEEAIMHLNKNCLSNDITHSSPNWTADSWTAVADGFKMTRSLGTSRYMVTILTTAPYSLSRPAIVSEGYVPAPLSSVAPQSMFAVIGDVSPNQTFATNQYVGRKVRVTTALDGVFVKAMVAKESIDLSGNRISTDSFDSQDSAFSTGGLYDINKRKDNGDVATNSKLFDSFNVGNADIRGRVATGPGGLVSVGPNGGVGTSTWIDSAVHGIQPGRSSDDMNVAFQDVLVPFTSGYSTPTGGSVTNTVVTPPGGFVTTTNLPTNAVSVVTNTIVANSTNYPAADTYVGLVITNQYASIITNSTPASSTGYPINYVGDVTTNTTTVTSNVYPSLGTYLGAVTTNTVSTNTVAAPVVGTYLGSVTTNTVSTTTVAFPGTGTYVGAVTTNTTLTTVSGWDKHPAVGTYTTITTNTAPQHSGSGSDGKPKLPAGGTYLPGSLVVTYGTSGQANGYDYLEIKGFTYDKITGYTYAKISTYTYNKISSYNFFAISGYTTNYLTSGFTYNRKKDYTYSTSVAVTNQVVTVYDYILYDGDYLLSNMSGNTLVRGNARLYVTDDIQITGKNGILIDPTYSLKMYSGAPSVNIAGNGVINNGGNATNFYYFGLPSNTDLKLAGNASFTGVIYAPSASYTLGGGGNDTYDFIGASVSRTVKMNGHYNFHYDENLGRVASFRGFVIRSWNEIPLSQAK